MTKAQLIRLSYIKRACDRAGICSRYDAGYPNWPMVLKLEEAGLIEIDYEEPGQSIFRPVKGYRITQAGRDALG